MRQLRSHCSRGHPLSGANLSVISPGRRKAIRRVCLTCHAARQRRWASGVGSPDEVIREKPTTCEICAAHTRIVHDHCHKSGAFRGWLCHNCNAALGLAYDNPQILDKLAEYLRQHA